LLTPHPTHHQADGDDSGAIIDPVVNRVANSKITAQDAATFAQRYDDTHTWTFSQLYGVSPPYMRVKFRSCTHGLPCTDACTPLEANASNQIVGIGGDGSCVYWVDVPSASLPWECLNDGTCAQSTRGNYSSEAECVASCGGGHFACVAGPHPTCQPDPNGQCYTLEQCEAGCGSTVVCPEPPPPPSPPPSPPPPPPPPPPHYSDPVLTGCLPDELELSLTGVPGSGTFCAPACNGTPANGLAPRRDAAAARAVKPAANATCPADVPAGVAAKPACMIRDPIGAGWHCALHCTADAECGPRGECSTAYGTGYGVCEWLPAPPRCKEEDDPDDCAALLALNLATDHGPRHKIGWRMDGSVSLCDWEGVCCGDPASGGDPTGGAPPNLCRGTGYSGRVNMLRVGGYPSHTAELTGTLPTQLARLAAVTVMDFNCLHLRGTIPPELSTMPTLGQLTMADNSLTGTVPTELAALAALTYLHVGMNQISGTVPSQLGALKALAGGLDMGGNALSGTLPTQLAALASLAYLGAHANAFSGSVPSWLAQMPALTTL
jgi:hypothetical protein